MDTTWKDVFLALSEPPTCTCSQEASQGQKQHLIVICLLWDVALHWAIKIKWDSKHKIPYPRKLKSIMEPFGVLAFWYLELCIQCHSFLRPNPYQTAAHWFWCLVRESQRNSVFNTPQTSKTKSLESKRIVLKQLGDGINPIQDDLAPHESLLMETCLSFNRGDNFDKEYFTPFLRAYRRWITATDKADWGAIIQESSQIYVQAHRGKGKFAIKLNIPF